MNAVPSSSSWTSTDQPVLVAVDGHADDLEAVAWAAAEAAARRTHLTVLHVCRWPLHGDPLSAGYPLVDPCRVLDDARQVLETAAEQARQVTPGLVVKIVQGIGDPARLIVVEGKPACLVVLGRRDGDTARGLRRRSVTRHVVARSGQPVVVVGRSTPASSGQAAGRVVAALPPSRSGCGEGPVLDAAFAAAQRRGLGLTVLAPGSPHAASPETNLETPTIESVTQLYTRVFDDVDVRRQRLAGALGPHLQRESQSAALLVIPAPVRGRRRDLSGSTLEHLLATVSAPITLVHPTQEWQRSG